MKPEEMSPLQKINTIFRLSYTLPFVLASLAGVLFALPAAAPGYVYALIPLTVFVMAAFVNFSNTFFDFEDGTDSDRLAKGEGALKDGIPLKKIYWDDNPFASGLVSVRTGKIVMVLMVALIVAMSIPIVLHSPYYALAFGITGLFLAYFYTAPPVCLGGRGLGEISTGIAFFLMCLGSYAVPSGGIAAWVAVCSVSVGLGAFLMRTVDSISGTEKHIEAGEKSLHIMLGTEKVVWVIKAALIVLYAFAALACFRSVLFAVAFVSLPLGARGWKIISERAEGWEFRAIPVFFLVTLLTEISFIAAASVGYLLPALF